MSYFGSDAFSDYFGDHEDMLLEDFINRGPGYRYWEDYWVEVLEPARVPDCTFDSFITSDELLEEFMSWFNREPKRVTEFHEWAFEWWNNRAEYEHDCDKDRE